MYLVLKEAGLLVRHAYHLMVWAVLILEFQQSDDPHLHVAAKRHREHGKTQTLYCAPIFRERLRQRAKVTESFSYQAQGFRQLSAEKSETKKTAAASTSRLNRASDNRGEEVGCRSCSSEALIEP